MEDLREDNKIEINFVYSKDKCQIKSFLDSIPSHSEYINYLDIYNKLAKNDFYQCEPSDEVITSYLIKQLYLSLSKNVQEIYYEISTLDKDTLNNIKSFIQSIAECELEFNIYHSDCTYLNGTSKLFNKSFIL